MSDTIMNDAQSIIIGVVFSDCRFLNNAGIAYEKYRCVSIRFQKFLLVN